MSYPGRRPGLPHRPVLQSLLLTTMGKLSRIMLALVMAYTAGHGALAQGAEYGPPKLVRVLVSPTEIIRLMTAGANERQLVAMVASMFPELTRTEFIAALQDATAAAERQALRPH